MKLSVVMPVYNEVETIDEIVNRVHAVTIEKELIIIDDGSTDGTREKLERISRIANTRVIFQERNQGKGAALRAGFQSATGDVVIVQDADLEYDPREYPVLLQPIIDGRADVVFGSRFLSGPHRVLFFWHRVGNGLLTIFSNMMNDINLTDMETCYKAFRAEVLKKIDVTSNRFGFEPEITAKVARLGCRIYEVPISYSGRTYDEGKKITWKDGLSAVFSIVRFRFFD